MSNIIDFDCWENQRLSPNDNVFSHESLMSGDRPAWSTKDGKRAQHRDAFLLPDLSWRWDGPWAIADIDGKVLDPFEAQSQGGWLYAPSFLLSTKSCSKEQNALSLVRRRRWMRRAVKNSTAADLVPATVVVAHVSVDPNSLAASSPVVTKEPSKLLQSLPHPVLVAHYGYSTSPELVASSANSPMLNKEVAAAASPQVSFASRAFSAFKSFSPFGNKDSSNNSNSGFASSAAASGGGGGEPKTPQRGGNNSNTTSSGLHHHGAPVSNASISEVALLLKHHSTFETMQNFMAELVAGAAASNGTRAGASQTKADSFSDGSTIIPQNISTILRDSGIPQGLRAPMWLAFSGALALKMRRGGNNFYRNLVEKCQKEMQNPKHCINLDVMRTCSTHPFFSNGTGPGAIALRNILFAFEQMKREEAEEKVRKAQQRQKQLENEEAGRSSKVQQRANSVVDELFAPAAAESAATVGNSDDQKAEEEHLPTPQALGAALTDGVLDVMHMQSPDKTKKVDAEEQQQEQQQQPPTKPAVSIEQRDKHLDEPTFYHQPLSYVCSIFVMNCSNEEDAFWLLTVVADQCPLMQSVDSAGHAQMDDCVQLFKSETLRRAQAQLAAASSSSSGNNNSYQYQRLTNIVQLLQQVDLSIGAYSWFQALLCAHVSCPVASRLFDVFLVNVRNVRVFVDFAATLVLKCLQSDALTAFVHSETGGGMLDTVTATKFLNEELRRVSCDLQL